MIGSSDVTTIHALPCTYNPRVSVPGLEAFHFGFVMRDLDAVTGLYGRMLGITRWLSAEST